jgi:hypothetical protein
MNKFDSPNFDFLSSDDDLPKDVKEEVELEIVDDTPEEDKVNSTPLPKEIIDEIEADDLESYSKEAKQRVLQYKKAFHDQRRRAEEAERKAEETERVANYFAAEKSKLEKALQSGEQVYQTVAKEKVASDLEKARREYKEAYDSGDADRLVEAQERLTEIKFKAQEIERYKPQYDEESLQNSQNSVQTTPQQSQPQRLDSKTQAWLDKNKWYGTDDDMSFLAMGIHKRLEREGVPIGSDHYWQSIDTEVRKRFPDKFQDPAETKSSATTRKSTVVAPATRSTSSKKITLNTRQLELAKKFKLTPEQYWNELKKTESQNG